MPVARGQVYQVFERLARVDRRLWPGIFFGVLGLYSLAVVVQSTRYSGDARLFPLVVGVPFLCLVGLKLVLLAAGDRLGLESMELFNVQDRFERTDGIDVDSAVRYQREFETVLWLFGLGLVLWAFGFLFALLVFLFSFIAVYERNPVRGAVAALLTYAFVYFFFVQLLGASIYGGAYPLGIPGLTT